MKSAVVLLGAVVLLCGCTTGPAAAPTSNISAPSASPEPSFQVAPDGVVNEDTDETMAAEVVPTWDAAAEAAATDAATAALTAFSRPGTPQDQWWEELRPHLTQEAAESYVYTDAINVPASKVTGGATVVQATSAYLVLVDVATDVGVYQVLMVRADGDSPWLVGEFAPPPDLGP